MNWDTDIETRRVSFECSDGSSAVFIPRCKCGRFVKPHDHILTNDFGLSPEPNADCKRCGPVMMIFEGFF